MFKMLTRKEPTCISKVWHQIGNNGLNRKLPISTLYKETRFSFTTRFTEKINHRAPILTKFTRPRSLVIYSDTTKYHTLFRLVIIAKCKIAVWSIKKSVGHVIISCFETWEKSEFESIDVKL